MWNNVGEGKLLLRLLFRNKKRGLVLELNWLYARMKGEKARRVSVLLIP